MVTKELAGCQAGPVETRQVELVLFAQPGDQYALCGKARGLMQQCAFADAGFDIDLSPMFSTPEEVVRQAIENDVHVIGVSSQAAVC